MTGWKPRLNKFLIINTASKLIRGVPNYKSAQSQSGFHCVMAKKVSFNWMEIRSILK